MNNRISIHEVRLFIALLSGGWHTAGELAQASGVATRTARRHCLRLVKAGIAELSPTFPAFRYRISQQAEKRNGDYFARLTGARRVFGL